MKKQFRIPTILGILLVALLIGGLAIITQFLMRSPTEADVGKIPHNVVFSNISDTGFTVTWQTDAPTRGIVQAKESNSTTSPILYFDERHVPGDIGSYTTHSVPLRGLKASTGYTIFILENETATIKKDTSYTQSTGPSLELVSNTLGPTYGSVMMPDGTPGVGSLVYLTLPDSQTLSTLVKPSGSFLISLNLLRTADAASYLNLDSKNPTITITIHTGTVITNVVTDALNNSPIPEVIIGKTYDFRGKSQESQRNRQAKIVENLSTFSNILGADSTSSRIGITTPAQGSYITNPYPFFSGTGIPDMFVTLTIGMKNPQVSSIKVARDGTWTFTPKKPIGIGNQSVTMTTLDAKNKPVAFTHLFEILKSGTQVLGSATPSGTLTPTRTPSLTPTIRLTGTPVPTLFSTSTPTPTAPDTGTTIPTTLIFSIGLLITFGGIAALLL
jgi:hypothetical protein